MTPAKIEALMKKHAVRLQATSSELATNFDVPARDIIAMACSAMGITKAQYDAIQRYRIAKEDL